MPRDLIQTARPRTLIPSALWASLLVALFALPAHAGSIINDNAPNGIFFTVESVSHYEGTTLPFPVRDSSAPGMDQKSVAWGGQDPAGHYIASGSSTLTPTTGSAKDEATGTASIDFYFGETVDPFDSLWFEMDTLTSAFTAQNSVGDPANAIVEQLLTVSFYLDSSFSGGVTGDYVGTYSLSGLRATNPGESYVLKVAEFIGAAKTTTTLAPGVGTASVDLYLDRGYEFSLSYRVVTDFGDDPAYNLQIGGDITPFSVIPEPSTGLLVVVGLGMLSCRRTAVGQTPMHRREGRA